MLWGILLAVLVTALIGGSTRVARRAPPSEGFKHLEPGKTYEVIKAFRDASGRTRDFGEVWLFKGFTYVPYNNLTTLHLDPGPDITLVWNIEGQQDLIDNLTDYIVEI